MATSYSNAWMSDIYSLRSPGTVYYVDGTNGASGNSGTAPNQAKDTITNGIALMSAGDTLIVAAGTYAEDVEIDVNQTTFIFHHGVVIAGQSADQALLISASYVRMYCEHGSLRVNPIATKTGVKLTGDWCYLNDIRVPCNSSANTGFDVDDGADGHVLTNCRCSAPLVAAFKCQGDKCKFHDCCTGGNTGDSSIGFWFTGTSDKARVRECGSQGHESGGFVVDATCTNGVIESCYSGGGDGKWSDPNHNFVWSHFAYERYKVANITLDGSTTYNLYTVTGAVKIMNVSMIVTGAIANTSSDINLELVSTNGSDDITASGGPNIQADVVGTVYSRVSGSGDELAKFEPDNTPGVIENASFRDPHVPIILVEDDAATTYIQLVLSDAVASGNIRAEIEWEPVHFFSSDGFVEVT
jgi:hypothetical protein